MAEQKAKRVLARRVIEGDVLVVEDRELSVVAIEPHGDGERPDMISFRAGMEILHFFYDDKVLVLR